MNKLFAALITTLFAATAFAQTPPVNTTSPVAPANKAEVKADVKAAASDVKTNAKQAASDIKAVAKKTTKKTKAKAKKVKAKVKAKAQPRTEVKAEVKAAN
ncbi:MAG: hypothetical protein V4632_20815 [Pseudomonadota bacterium]